MKATVFKFVFTSILLTAVGECFCLESGGTKQIEVAVNASNTYKADTFILVFDIYDMKVSQREQAVFQLQSKSNEILTNIRNQGVKISEAKVSSALSRVEFHYNNTAHRYESSSYLVVDHQLQLDNFRDYIVAYSVLLSSGIPEDDIGAASQLLAASKSKGIVETFKKAGTLAIAKAKLTAQQNNFALGQPVYVQTSETQVSPIYIKISESAELEPLIPKSVLEDTDRQRSLLSDEIELSVSLLVIFDGFVQ